MRQSDGLRGCRSRFGTGGSKDRAGIIIETKFRALALRAQIQQQAHCFESEAVPVIGVFCQRHSKVPGDVTQRGARFLAVACGKCAPKDGLGGLFQRGSRLRRRFGTRRGRGSDFFMRGNLEPRQRFQDLDVLRMKMVHLPLRHSGEGGIAQSRQSACDVLRFGGDMRSQAEQQKFFLKIIFRPFGAGQSASKKVACAASFEMWDTGGDRHGPMFLVSATRERKTSHVP